MEISTAKQLEALEYTDKCENFVYSKIYKSDVYSIRRESEKRYAIIDKEFYVGSLYFSENLWRLESRFFDVDYEEGFNSLQEALDFIIKKTRTDLIRIIF